MWIIIQDFVIYTLNKAFINGYSNEYRNNTFCYRKNMYTRFSRAVVIVILVNLFAIFNYHHSNHIFVISCNGIFHSLYLFLLHIDLQNDLVLLSINFAVRERSRQNLFINFISHHIICLKFRRTFHFLKVCIEELLVTPAKILVHKVRI